MALVTLDLVKEHLDIPLANTSQDASLNLLITVVSGHIAQFCDRAFEEATYTETLDGTSQSEVLLQNYPVSSVTSVHVDNDRVFDAQALVDAEDYEIVDDNTLRRHDSKWPRGSQNIQVVYTAGFATIPAAVQYATLLIIEQLYRSNQDRRIGRSSTSKNGETVNYLHGWPEEAKNLLATYKRHEFAGGRSRWSY